MKTSTDFFRSFLAILLMFSLVGQSLPNYAWGNESASNSPSAPKSGGTAGGIGGGSEESSGPKARDPSKEKKNPGTETQEKTKKMNAEEERKLAQALQAQMGDNPCAAYQNLPGNKKDPRDPCHIVEITEEAKRNAIIMKAVFLVLGIFCLIAGATSWTYGAALTVICVLGTFVASAADMALAISLMTHTEDIIKDFDKGLLPMIGPLIGIIASASVFFGVSLKSATACADTTVAYAYCVNIALGILNILLAIAKAAMIPVYSGAISDANKKKRAMRSTVGKFVEDHNQRSAGSNEAKAEGMGGGGMSEADGPATLTDVAGKGDETAETKSAPQEKTLRESLAAKADNLPEPLKNVLNEIEKNGGPSFNQALEKAIETQSAKDTFNSVVDSLGDKVSAENKDKMKEMYDGVEALPKEKKEEILKAGQQMFDEVANHVKGMPKKSGGDMDFGAMLGSLMGGKQPGAADGDKVQGANFGTKKGPAAGPSREIQSSSASIFDIVRTRYRTITDPFLNGKILVPTDPQSGAPSSNPYAK